MVKSDNEILLSLGREDMCRLEPYLHLQQLPKRQKLERRKHVADHVYFIETGLASLVSEKRGSRTIEVGVVGREGLIGLSMILGVNGPADHDIYMQVAGSAFRIANEDLRTILAESPALQLRLTQYAYLFIRQLRQTAVANARHTISERLARWLLLSHDRIGHVIPLTQEFLSMMLGVHRPGVTLAIQELEKEGLIDYGRGQIIVVNRPALEKRARGAYDPMLRA